MAEMLAQTSLPIGAFSVLPCTRSAGNVLVEDPRIKVLSFTGSPTVRRAALTPDGRLGAPVRRPTTNERSIPRTRDPAPPPLPSPRASVARMLQVGYDLMSKAGKKRCVLELGGNAACVVDRDADIATTVDRLVFGAFYQSGQSCIRHVDASTPATVSDACDRAFALTSHGPAKRATLPRPHHKLGRVTQMAGGRVPPACSECTCTRPSMSHSSKRLSRRRLP